MTTVYGFSVSGNCHKLRLLLEHDDGRVLAESNAILCYLAEGTPYLPDDAWERARALSWMFFEQYSHEPCIAVARFICGWLARVRATPGFVAMPDPTPKNAALIAAST